MRSRLPKHLRKTAIGLSLMLIPLSLLGVHLLLQNEFGTARELRQTVTETVETRRLLSELLTLHLDMETGMRGYVLSGNEVFLEPYNRGYRRRGELLARLQPHLANDPGSATLLVEIVRNSNAKLAFTREAVDMARAGQRDAAIALVAQGEGRRRMDAIRVQIEELDGIEIGHLDAVVRNDQGLSRQIERIVSLVLSALALLLAIVAGVVARSIRQRGEALARVRLLSERQAAMFDGGVDGMMLLDARGYIMRLNPSVMRMFGYASEELIGQHNTQLMEVPFDLETSQIWLDKVGKAGLDGAGRRQEFTGRRKDGTTFATEVAVSRVSDGEDRRYVAAIRDISAFKRAEEMKNEFVSTVSHELRTPLTSIAGSLGLLSAGAVGQLNDKAARLVGIAHSNCERLIRLINDILDIEKIESGKMHFAEEEVDIGALIEWTVAANRSLADSKEVELVAETPSERVLVRGDADRLEQLLTNLVSNAIKHSPTGGTVEVAATTGSTRIAIDVMDRGAGIPEEFRSRIFGKFAMADTSDTRAKGGSGLGLSIAREIAHHHSGTILFQDRPGGGTIFRAELPVLAQVEQPRKSSRKLPVLLHVDDDRDCLSVVASAFEDRAEVLTVGTIEEARRAIARHRIDGAILDIGLRDGNGGSLVPLLRRRDPTMPVVVFSAIDEPHSQFAADAVVIKSRASLDDLVSTTMALLGERGSVAA